MTSQIWMLQLKKCGSSQANATPFSVSDNPEPCFFPLVSRKPTNHEKSFLNPLSRPIYQDCLVASETSVGLSRDFTPIRCVHLVLCQIRNKPKRLHFQASRTVGAVFRRMVFDMSDFDLIEPAHTNLVSANVKAQSQAPQNYSTSA